jgi:D-3-phosphoglycerate dehydrogenase
LSRVLLTDGIASDAVGKLESFVGVEAVTMGTPTPQELLALIPDFEAIIVRSPTQVTAQVIAAGRRLKFIGRAGVGVDNIDVAAATARGIVVINSPRSNTTSTAEHALAMMLAVAREIPRAHATVASGRWERDTFRGVELAGKTLGIVGLGRVGRAVAVRARAFEMRVVACDPFVSEQQAAGVGIQLVTFPELIRMSEWITLHVPLGADTRKLIGATEIAAMRDGVVIVNCSRGGVVDEDALVTALDANKVRAVALDVFEQEPPVGSALLRHPRSVFAPHLGAATSDAQRRVATDVAESVGLALTGGEIRDAVYRSS